MHFSPTWQPRVPSPIHKKSPESIVGNGENSGNLYFFFVTSTSFIPIIWNICIVLSVLDFSLDKS